MELNKERRYVMNDKNVNSSVCASSNKREEFSMIYKGKFSTYARKTMS